jgi:hypothetical protein
MKHVRRFCATIVLTLALSFSAFAGDILIPGATTQPTPQQKSSMTSAMPEAEDSSTGDILIPGADALDPVTQFTLSLLQSLLSLF